MAVLTRTTNIRSLYNKQNDSDFTKYFTEYRPLVHVNANDVPPLYRIPSRPFSNFFAVSLLNLTGNSWPYALLGKGTHEEKTHGDTDPSRSGPTLT